jgi:hypothetical protein
MAKYLFGAGTARGGTGLATRMLSVSPTVEIALDPYLALYKSLRSAAVGKHGSDTLKSNFRGEVPIQDYYFSDTQLQVLDAIWASDLSLPFQANERVSLIEMMKKRSVLSSGDLSPVMSKLDGATYLDWFTNAMNLIIETRKKPNLSWVGLHENWTIEFFVPLAKSFPDAKFMIVLRDPRAVIASNMKVTDLALKGHILSYARSLRKLLALTLHYQKHPLFKNRLAVARFEDLVVEPEKHCKRLCDFLQVPYHADMLDTSKYIEPADGSVYNGFSSFEKTAEGISTHRISRWKKHLTAGEIDLIDFILGPEMAMFGYAMENLKPGDALPPAAFQALIEDNEGTKNWRTDFQDPQMDLGFELFRKSVLESSSPVSENYLKRCFLVPEIVKDLRAGLLPSKKAA